MPATFHVNGPAKLDVVFGAEDNRTSGTLGITEAGVQVTINQFDETVMTDAAGTKMPADIQNMGSDAVIRAKLVVWDDVVFDDIRNRTDETIATGPGSVGTLFLTAGKTFGLTIASPLEPARLYTFPTCILRNAVATTLSTKRTAYDIEIYAFVPVGDRTTAPTQQVLYTVGD